MMINNIYIPMNQFSKRNKLGKGAVKVDESELPIRQHRRLHDNEEFSFLAWFFCSVIGTAIYIKVLA